MTEVAEKLSTATGKTICYVNVPPEAARQAQLAAGMPPFLLAARCSNCLPSPATARGPGSGLTPPRCWDSQPTSFDDFARRNAAVFRGEAPPKV